MRMTKLIFTLLALALAAPFTTQAAGNRAAASDRRRPTSVRGILIIASRDRGPADPKLAAYEAILHNALRFESYRYVSETTTTVEPGGKGTLTLGSNRLSLISESDETITVRGRNDIAVPIAPRGPGAVLVGGSAGGKGEVFAVIVMAK